MNHFNNPIIYTKNDKVYLPKQMTDQDKEQTSKNIAII